MSVYLPPILHNNELNSTFNSNDFNYQFESINYVQGDKRYTKNQITIQKQVLLTVHLIYWKIKQLNKVIQLVQLHFLVMYPYQGHYRGLTIRFMDF